MLTQHHIKRIPINETLIWSDHSNHFTVFALWRHKNSLYCILLACFTLQFKRTSFGRGWATWIAVSTSAVLHDVTQFPDRYVWRVILALLIQLPYLCLFFFFFSSLRRHTLYNHLMICFCHHWISVEPKKHSVTQLMQILYFLIKWHQVRGIWLNIEKIRQTLCCNRFCNSSLVSGRHKGLFFL